MAGLCWAETDWSQHYLIDWCMISIIVIAPLVLYVAEPMVFSALFGMIFGMRLITPFVSRVLYRIELPHLYLFKFNLNYLILVALTSQPPD